MDQQKIKDRLRDKGLKATSIRMRLLEFLQQAPSPLSIEEIHNQANLECNLTSIYRACSALEKHGFLSYCDFRDGMVRYQISLDDAHHHHHIICRDCQKVLDVNVCLPTGFESALAHTGFKNISHQLEFFGSCGACAIKGSQLTNK